MAASDFLTDRFLRSVKRRGNISTSTDGWSDSDLLEIATEEMRDSIVPWLRRLGEEYLVTDYDQNIASGTSAYPLPHWALGEGLRDVQIADGSGGYYPLSRKKPQDVAAIAAQNRPACYFIQDSKVVLVPTPSTSVTNGLRLRCLRRPSRLVGLSRGIAITGASTSTAVVDTYALDGTTARDTLMALLDSNSSGVDVVTALPGFRLQQSEQGGSYDSVTGTFTWTTALSAAPSAGDYLCYAGESVVPQIPAELHALLAQSTVVAFLRASGQPGLQDAEAKRMLMEKEAKDLFSPRTENQPTFIRNRYGVRTG